MFSLLARPPIAVATDPPVSVDHEDIDLPDATDKTADDDEPEISEINRKPQNTIPQICH